MIKEHTNLDTRKSNNIIDESQPILVPRPRQCNDLNYQ